MVKCTKCVQPHEERPDEVPEQPILSGRKDVLVNHLKSCHFAPRESLLKEEEDKAAGDCNSASVPFAGSQSPANGSSSTSSVHLHDRRQKKKQNTLHSFIISPFSEDTNADGDHSGPQLAFPLNRTRIGPSRSRVSQLCCSASPPVRKQLAINLLDRCAEAADDGKRATLLQHQSMGERVNLVLDGWENSDHRHILGVVLNLFGAQWTFAAAECTVRQDGLAIAEHIEKLIEKLTSDGWRVGAVVTDNAGQSHPCFAVSKFDFIFCFAHQVNLLVKDVLTKVFGTVAEEASAMINVFRRYVQVVAPPPRING
ncbi:hypothetical protein PsorP6_015512 [Peronosclerospora sorghi]|uniref:Uncharacterized protein n=1 Tax=Peronosclerospora sorghi TaxID=230839 RepID=A0ACC0WP58_9STRA|nr:hypothetical protein PsorP6_015512 [Peronosclerospora sorghi]